MPRTDRCEQYTPPQTRGGGGGAGGGYKNITFVEASVMNSSAKFQLHPPYGFWRDDFLLLFSYGKDLKWSLQQIALTSTSKFNFWENQRILAFPIAINLYLLDCLSFSLKEMKCPIFGPNSLFLLSNLKETGKVLFKYVCTLAQPKYFASMRIFISYIIYINAMIGQGWEHRHTAQNANNAK